MAVACYDCKISFFFFVMTPNLIAIIRDREKKNTLQMKLDDYHITYHFLFESY